MIVRITKPILRHVIAYAIAILVIEKNTKATISPVGQQNHGVRPFHAAYTFPSLARLKPLQRPRKCTPTTSANQETFYTNESASRKEGLFVICLYPYINVTWCSRQDVRNKVVTAGCLNARQGSQIQCERTRCLRLYIGHPHFPYLMTEEELIRYPSVGKVPRSAVHLQSALVRTGSIATMNASLLCVFFIALETPLTVPPVPAPAIKASILPEDGRDEVDDEVVMAEIISGPVLSSCAKGLLRLRSIVRVRCQTKEVQFRTCTLI